MLALCDGDVVAKTEQNERAVMRTESGAHQLLRDLRFAMTGSIRLPAMLPTPIVAAKTPYCALSQARTCFT